MKNTKKFLVLTLAALTVVVGCKQDEDEPTPGAARTLNASIEPHWGNFSFSLGTAYLDDFGTQIKITKFRMYLSGFDAQDHDGNSIGTLSKTALVDASGFNDLSLGTVSEGHVHEVKVYIGLDSLTNHADPMLAQSPLNDATMHWGWNPTSGYKFVVIEGQVDSDGNGTIDSTDDGFAYHLATDGLYTALTLNTDVDINEGETKNLHVEVDLQQVLDGIDVASNLDTHTNNEPALAAQLMANLAGAIQVQ